MYAWFFGRPAQQYAEEPPQKKERVVVDNKEGSFFHIWADGPAIWRKIGVAGAFRVQGR